MNIAFLIQARLGSSRLPNKILMDLLPEEPLLEIIFQRIQKVREGKIKVYVLTTTNPTDDTLAAYLDKRGIQHFRGDEHDVFKRYFDFLKNMQEPVEYFFRICADNPLIEPSFIEQMIDFVEAHQSDQYDYVSFKSSDDVPVIQNKYGLFCELIKTDTFLKVRLDLLDSYQKEHVTPIFYTDKKFKIKLLDIPHAIELNELRYTIDTAEDAAKVKKILLQYGRDVTYKELIECNPARLDWAGTALK
jgi:spore coat polysaccharide biosynthesis protein SpsF